MSTPRGIDRQGLPPSFEADEVRKSNLLLEAHLLQAQQPDEAADRFARAAEIEERLSQECRDRGLPEKSWVHQFSAAGCWAQAGNFHEAITLGDELLAVPDLPPRLRQQVQEFTQTLRQRRRQWLAALAVPAAVS
jgi:hypothetical protein